MFFCTLCTFFVHFLFLQRHLVPIRTCPLGPTWVCWEGTALPELSFDFLWWAIIHNLSLIHAVSSLGEEEWPHSLLLEWAAHENKVFPSSYVLETMAVPIFSKEKWIWSGLMLTHVRRCVWFCFASEKCMMTKGRLYSSPVIRMIFDFLLPCSFSCLGDIWSLR